MFLAVVIAGRIATTDFLVSVRSPLFPARAACPPTTPAHLTSFAVAIFCGFSCLLASFNFIAEVDSVASDSTFVTPVAASRPHTPLQTPCASLPTDGTPDRLQQVGQPRQRQRR